MDELRRRRVESATTGIGAIRDSYILLTNCDCVSKCGVLHSFLTHVIFGGQYTHYLTPTLTEQ